jgi:hypothetical protein
MRKRVNKSSKIRKARMNQSKNLTLKTQIK